MGGECAAPFVAVEAKLYLLLGFGRVDEGQGRGVALVEVLERCHASDILGIAVVNVKVVP